VANTLDGIVLTPGQYIGYVGTFVITSAFAIGLLRKYFQSLQEPSRR
jgi:hypothetical protein